MNTLRNKVQLIGHLGQDPEVFRFDGGKTKVTMSIATNETYRNKEGEKVENTYWHNLVVWGKPAEVAEKYLKKGSELAVEGKLTSRSYETREGEKRYVTEVIVNELMLMGSKKD